MNVSSIRATALAAALLVPLLPAVAPPALAEDIAEKAAICEGCHGAAGDPIRPDIANIWGQSNGYIYLQLRDIKNGTRKVPEMEPIVKDLTRDDMRALAAFYSEKPWPPHEFEAQAGDADIASHMLAAGLCTECHLDKLQGDATVPRLAGQSPGYLLKTMMDFRTRARANAPFMTDLLNTYSEAEVQAFARFAASLGARPRGSSPPARPMPAGE